MGGPYWLSDTHNILKILLVLLGWLFFFSHQIDKIRREKNSGNTAGVHTCTMLVSGINTARRTSTTRLSLSLSLLIGCGRVCKAYRTTTGGREKKKKK
jgi:hypothetical protein